MATYLPQWKAIKQPYCVDPAKELHRFDVVHVDDAVGIYWAANEQLLMKLDRATGQWYTSRLINVWPTPRVEASAMALVDGG